MRIYLKKNRAKFLPDPIWNDKSLGFLEGCHPNKNNKLNNKMSVSSWSKNNQLLNVTI